MADWEGFVTRLRDPADRGVCEDIRTHYRKRIVAAIHPKKTGADPVMLERVAISAFEAVLGNLELRQSEGRAPVIEARNGIQDPLLAFLKKATWRQFTRSLSAGEPPLERDTRRLIRALEQDVRLSSPSDPAPLPKAVITLANRHIGRERLDHLTVLFQRYGEFRLTSTEFAQEFWALAGIKRTLLDGDFDQHERTADPDPNQDPTAVVTLPKVGAFFDRELEDNQDVEQVLQQIERECGEDEWFRFVKSAPITKLERTAFMLTNIGGYSYAHAAQICSQKLTAFRSHVDRARKKLKTLGKNLGIESIRRRLHRLDDRIE